MHEHVVDFFGVSFHNIKDGHKGGWTVATIKQIADLAGVSCGTVDRVLNHRGIVNAETAAKIREIAEAVQYSPNRVGKTLSLKKKNIKLGYILLSSTSGNPFWDDVTLGIKAKARELEEYGVSVEIRFSEFASPEHQVTLMEELRTQGVCGLAITPVNHPDVAKKIRELSEAGIPVVTANTDIENSGRLAYVGSNYAQSGKTAGGLMRIATGGKANIGVVTGSPEVLCHSERLNGFQQSIAKHCPESHIVEIVENHDDDFESFAAVKQLLAAHPEIDALYLCAAGVYGACRAVESLGLQKKLKIICFDCVPTTKKLLRSGTITATIDQQPLKQGSKPLDILFNYLAMGTLPPEDKIYTTIEIRIRENL